MKFMTTAQRAQFQFITATRFDKWRMYCELLNVRIETTVHLYGVLFLEYISWSQPECVWCETTLHWRHNDHDCISNHQPHGCLLNRLFRRRSNKTSKLCVTGLCVANSPGTGEFPAQRANYAENVSIWWRHHAYGFMVCTLLHVSIFSAEDLHQSLRIA